MCVCVSGHVDYWAPFPGDVAPITANHTDLYMVATNYTIYLLDRC